MAKSKGSERGGGDGVGPGKKVGNGVEGASGAGGWQWSSSATGGGRDDGVTRQQNRQSRLKEDIRKLEEWRRNENLKIGRSDSRIRLITFQIQKREQKLRDIELKSQLQHGEIIGGNSAIQSESLAAGLKPSASGGVPGDKNRSSLRSALAALEGPALSAVTATVVTRVAVVGSTADGEPSAVGEAFAVNTSAGGASDGSGASATNASNVGTTARQASTTAKRAANSDAISDSTLIATPTSNGDSNRMVRCNFSAVGRSNSEILGGSTTAMQAGTTAWHAGTTASRSPSTSRERVQSRRGPRRTSAPMPGHPVEVPRGRRESGRVRRRCKKTRTLVAPSWDYRDRSSRRRQPPRRRRWSWTQYARSARAGSRRRQGRRRPRRKRIQQVQKNRGRAVVALRVRARVRARLSSFTERRRLRRVTRRAPNGVRLQSRDLTLESDNR